MSVHYKFKSALEYDTVTFDGLHISVHDLKKSILHQKRIGKNTDFDLQITNAQTKEVYVDDGALIPKNTSLIVARVPLTAQQKKAWDRAESNQQLIGLSNVAEAPFDGQDPGAQKLATAVDLSSLDASEEDKIQAMMTQSTQDYNPSNYRKIKYANQMGEVPPTYRCFKCHQQGHWIKDCPLATVSEPIEIKKSTGIPRSFMVPVEGPSVPGAMMTPNGQFAVPAIDHLAYKEGKKEKPPFQHEPEPIVQKPEIPDDLQCSVCKDLLTDAVMIPCCGNSFCDECIRTVLLESEDHECPDCKEKDVSPETLIPNRFLRTSVNNFKKGTGYNKLSSSSRRSVLQHRPNLQAVKPAPLSLMEAIPVPVLGRNSPSTKLHPSSAAVVDYSDLLGDSSRDVPQVIQVQTCETTSTIPVLGAPKPPPTSLREASVILIDTATAAAAPKLLRADRAALVAEGSSRHHRNGANGVVPVMSVPSLGLRQVQPVDHSAGIIQAGATFATGQHRRSVEERPGTPTIDEHNMDAPPLAPPPTLPDTSVPPPNFPAAAAGEDPGVASHQIQSLGTTRSSHHGIPNMFRSEAPYPSQQQQHRGYSVRGQAYETGHYHQESGRSGSHYSDGDSHHIGRVSSYRYNRGRARIIHGYRGNHLHNQPPPPGLGRNAQNDPAAGAIEDPLEAFERMLREKDDRDRKLRRGRRPTTRSRSRSYTPHSRSTSTRSYTRSRSRTPRSRTPRSRTPRSRTPRSRTPRKRSRTPRSRSRSRSRSFTISRSRSRTFSRSPTPRQHSRDRGEYSPRRRAASRYRTPNRSPPRFQRPFKEVRPEFDSAAPYFEPEYQYANSANRGRAGRFGQRKDFNKDYYEQNYSRYGTEGGGRFHAEAAPRYGPQHRRYDHYSDVAPPGTEADLLPQRYDRGGGYEQHGGGGYESRQQQQPPPSQEDFLSPPGVDYRRAEPLVYASGAAATSSSSGRDRGESGAATSGRDRGGGRDRGEHRGEARDREASSWGGGGREAAEAGDRVRGDKDRDFGGGGGGRDRERDYYNDNGADHHHRGSYATYNSPDVLVKKSSGSSRRGGSTSPPRRGGGGGYSGGAATSSDRHHGGGSSSRHGGGSLGDGGGGRRRNAGGGGGGGKTEPLKAMDVTHDRKGRDPSDRERVPVLVEVRKEPSVEKDRKANKDKDKDDKLSKDRDKDKDKDKDKAKDRKKKKRERDADNDKDKAKKKKRKEKAKKEPQQQEQDKAAAAKGSSSAPRKEKVKATRAEEAEAASHTPEKPCPALAGAPAPPAEDKPVKVTAAPLNTAATDKAKRSGCTATAAASVEPPPQKDDLYGDMEDARIDDSVIANYGKVDSSKVRAEQDKEAGAVAEAEDAKAAAGADGPPEAAEPKANVMLAPLPEPSKWELDEEPAEDKSGDERVGATGAAAGADKSGKVVTSEVLKRAENAIFQKAINAIRPIEPSAKKASSSSSGAERKGEEASAEETSRRGGGGGGKATADKDAAREARKTANSIQITIPTSAGHAERSIELSPAKVKSKLDRSKFWEAVDAGAATATASPQRVPAKERLGARVEPVPARRTKRRSPSGKHAPAPPPAPPPPRKGLKSAVERRKTPSRSRSRSPHHKVGRRGEDRYAADRRNPSPAERRRSLSRDKKAAVVAPPPVKQHKEDRHKAKRKAKGGGDGRKDKEARHAKKKDKKHKKEKARKHKQKDEKKEGEAEKEPAQEPAAVAAAKAPAGAAEPDASKPPPPRKAQRRNPRLASDRKKSTLDEASFEPDYDASSSVDSDAGEDASTAAAEKKSTPPPPPAEKRPAKAAPEASAAPAKKRARSASSSSSSDDSSPDSSSSGATSSSSDDSSEDSGAARRRRRKKAAHKRRHKQQRAAPRKKAAAADSSSDSDSDSDSDDASSSDSGGGKARRAKKKHHSRRQAKAKASKKKKKSKHR